MLKSFTLPDADGKNFWSVEDVFAGRSTAVKAFLHCNYAIGMHTHEFTEVNLVIKGSGQHYVLDRAFATQQGDVFVIPPHMRHGYADGEGLDVYHFLISDRFFTESGLGLRMLPGFLPFFTLEPFYRAETDFRYAMRLDDGKLNQAVTLLRLLEEEVAAPYLGQDLAVASLSTYLLTCLCHWYTEQHLEGRQGEVGHIPTRAVQAVIRIVAAQYHEKLTLDNLAQTANMQRNYFCRIFRQVTGMTPMDYLQQYRVQIASRLLRETESSITEISYAVGFADASHFCRVFSRIMALSPSRYRKRG